MGLRSDNKIDAWADGAGRLDRVYHGDELVWPVTKVPMGMQKKTLQSLPANTRVVVDGMVARAGYPDTVIANDRLVPGFAGRVAVYAKASITGSMGYFESAINVYVMLNGTSIRSGSISGSGATTTTLSVVTVDLAATDQLWLEMQGSGSSNQISGTDSTTGRETYLYFDLV